MKKILSTAIFALAFAFSVSVVAQGYVFSKNLKFGMRNADVRALQEYLADAGFFSANPTGYFGSVTKRAVIAFQLANDLPGTGFVGPLTREVLNSGVVVNPGGNTPPGQTGSTTCPPGWTCTPPTGGTSSTGEGFAEVRLAPYPTNLPNVQTNTNVDVYGIEVTAKQSDITVERVNLEVSVTLSSAAENPATLINTILVKDGSNIIATIPVNSSTFSRDTSVTPNKYYVQIAGLGFKVMKDQKRTLTFAFNTNSIDSDRVVTVNVYGSTGIRSVDGRGISTYEDLADTRTHTFKKPGTSNLTAMADATTIYSTNYRINRTSAGFGADKVLTSTFALKSDTGPSKITGIQVLVGTTTLAAGTVPSNLYLIGPDGSTIDVKAVPTATTTGVYVNFDLTSYNVMVDADTTKTFTIKADMPSTTATGTILRTSVTSVTYEKPNGSQATLSSLSIAGPYHYFAPIVPQFGKISSNLSVLYGGPSGAASGVQATFKATVKAQGGSVGKFMEAQISLVNTSTGATATTSTTTAQIEGSPSMFSEGAVNNIEFTKAFSSSGGLVPTGATYKAVITNVTWAALDNSGTYYATTTQSAGFELMDTNVVTY